MIFGAHIRRNSIKLDGHHNSALEQARGRMMLVMSIFMIAYAVLAFRVFDVSIIQGELGHVRAHHEQQDTVDLPADHVLKRGRIYDRNGVMLAGSLKTSSLYANPHLIDGVEETAQGLVNIFSDLSYGNVLQKLQSQKKFVWIKRNITPAEQYKVLELGQPGLEFEREDRRVYPQENLSAHILGFTNIDNHGLAGIERSFDQMLSAGEDINLSIDVRLQHVLRRELGKAISDFSAIGGAGIIMDVQTGELLAGTSLPDFKPHSLSDAKTSDLFNRMTLGVYELGSVFKIFSTAALLDTHNLPMGTTFDAREPIKIGRFTINDYHAQKRELTIPEIFMHSSNIGAALMAQQVGTEGIRNLYDDLGLLRPLDFEIKEVGRPIVADPWREITTLTASYGHGIATTPLQLIGAVSSIVNGGLLVKPNLVKGAEGDTPRESLRVISERTSKKMNKLLRLVVTQGTGGNADVVGYLVGGKTGTAEKSTKHGYDKKSLISSFVGVFPMDNPRYAIYIMVDEPKGNKKSHGYATAGWVAAPAVGRVVQSMVSILGIAPKEVKQGAEMEANLIRYLPLEDRKPAKKTGGHLVSY